jgi:hypothetical protein
MFWLFFFKHFVSFIRSLCQLFVGLQVLIALQVASFGMLWILMIRGLQARDHAHHSDLWQLPVKELKASSSCFVTVPSSFSFD